MIKITSKSREKKQEQKEVDLVYLWVDGSDPKWLEKKSRLNKERKKEWNIHSRGRFIDNEELKYSLRSVEKYVSWLRRIFIVADDQQPEWLDVSHPKIRMIDHKEILPVESLPCFNSNVIEHNIYKIPSLSEKFLYANDDMLFNKPVSSDFFFGADGFPIVRLKKRPINRVYNKLRSCIGHPPGMYQQVISSTAMLVKEKMGRYYSGVPHHNIDAYKKSDYRRAMEEVFRKEVLESCRNKIRAYSDLQRLAVDLYAVSIGHAHLTYVGNSLSLRNQIHKDDAYARLEKYHPALFCMNDSRRVTDEDRKQAKAFLENHFPKKSAFEK